jgi:outer membrane immunogenic protein
MKNKLIVTILAGTWLLASQPGVADTSAENYAGLQYGVADYSEDGISKSYSPDALLLRVGKYLNPNLTIEGRLGTGLNSDTQFLPEFGTSGLDVKMELDLILGVYAAGHFNLTESASLYALVGISRVEADVTVPQFPAAKKSDDNTDLSYGVGAEIGIANNLALNVEYMQYLDESNFDLSALALGVTVRF